MESLVCSVCDGKSRLFVKNKETLRTFHICESCYYIFESEDEKSISVEDEKQFFKNQWAASPEGGNSGCYPHIVSLFETAGTKKFRSLDFGCGDGGLIRYLRQKGVGAYGLDRVPVENDMGKHVFKSVEELPEKEFELITLIEVMEHLHDPINVLKELVPLLTDDGFIYITTALTNRSMANIRFFPHWVYQRDKIHIGFFHEQTIAKIAEIFSLDWNIVSYGDIIMDKTFSRIVVTKDGKHMFANEQEEPPNWPLHKK